MFVAFARWKDDETFTEIKNADMEGDMVVVKGWEGSKHWTNRWRDTNIVPGFNVRYVHFIMSLKNPREKKKKGYKFGICFCLGDVMKSRITSEEIIKIKGQEWILMKCTLKSVI